MKKITCDAANPVEVLARTVQASSLTHTKGNVKARGQRILDVLGKRTRPGPAAVNLGL